MRQAETSPNTAPDIFDGDVQLEWRRRAECRDEDPDIFFSDREDSDTVRLAVRICGRCAVRSECYELAMRMYPTDSSDAGGVWGGTTQSQRNQIRDWQKQLAKEKATEAA